MKKTWLSIAALALAQNTWAANGSLLIGITPSSTSMGGIGVAKSNNSLDAMYKNPALLTQQTFGAGNLNAELITNFYKQGPTANSSLGTTGPQDTKSGVVIMPSFGVASKIGTDWAFGLGAYSYGGGIADFSNIPGSGLNGIQTKHVLTKVQPSLAYQANEWLSIGVGPFLAYNSLVTNEDLLGSGAGTTSTRDSSKKFGVGAQVGVSVKAAKGLTFGASYTTKSGVTFQDLINLSLLTASPNPAAARNSIRVTQPTEIAAGVHYEVTPDWNVGFDWRFIGWRGATGYADLQWKDQNVFALGTQYKLGTVALRAGFNYGSSPIESKTGVNPNATSDFQGFPVKNSSLDLLNLVAFPGMAESHITFGAGWAATEAFDLDLGFMYAPKVTRSRAALANAYTFTTSVTQWSVSLGGTYRF